MPSFQPPDDALEMARVLSPEPVTAVTELHKGSNSRVFRVDTVSGRYALKRYPASDSRDRLKAEANALRFFERKGVQRTPRLVSMAAERRFALLTWIDGDVVDAVADADVAEFAAFQILLDGAIDVQARGEIGEASDACLSGLRIVSQIERRYAMLEAVRHDFADFAAFFGEVLVPALHAFRSRAEEAYRRLDLDFSQEVVPGLRTLIPSDLGAHNALRGKDGKLCFLDFEYFGWDDPLTSVANFVMHPAMHLTEHQRAQYRDRLLHHFREDRVAERLEALMPLYALRWCAIILGELLPQRWQHRLDSSANVGSWDQVRREQIDKARRVMSRFEH